MAPSSLIELPPPPPLNWRNRLAYWRYLAMWETAALLPDRAARTIPHIVGRAWHRWASERQRNQVRANMRRLVGTGNPAAIDALVRDAYAAYARYWLDSFRLHRLDADRVLAESHTEGLEHVDAIRDTGDGGIFVTGHLGSWDIGALYGTRRGWRMVAVAEVVEPRPLFDRFVRLREDAGIAIVPLVRGGDLIGRLGREIRDQARLATLLADRDLTRRGPIVEFFGEPCRLPAGASILARRLGRPVVAGAFLTDGLGFRCVAREPIDISGLDLVDGTQAVARELEHLITIDPAQWHVFVPNWLADREPEHPVVAAWREGRDWQSLARSERRSYRVTI